MIYYVGIRFSGTWLRYKYKS